MTLHHSIRDNLAKMMGLQNPFNGMEIHENSSYNDLLFCYYHYYCNLGNTVLKPNDLPSYTAIDRVIRDLPNRKKNMSEEERYRIFYSGFS